MRSAIASRRTDGGLTFVEEVAPATGETAMACRIAGQADLTYGEVEGEDVSGSLSLERG